MKKLYVILPFLLQNAIWIPIRVILKYFTSFKIIGLENIKNVKGKVVFASNHSSELDPILIPASLPFLSHFMPIFYTSLEKNAYSDFGWKKYLYGGKFFKAWGAYCVYKGLRNYEKSLKHHIEILTDNNSVCIFPQGRRFFDNQVREIKGGVIFLSHQTQTPIIPVFIEGANEVSLKNFLLRKNKISVYFGKPLHVREILGDSETLMLTHEQNNYKKASQILMEKIMGLPSLMKKQRKDTKQQLAKQNYQLQEENITQEG